MLDRRVDPVETSGIMEPRFHPPGDKVLTNLSAVSAQATASVAAATDNSKYVVTGFDFRLGASLTLTAGTVGCNVIDGATGTTTYLYQGVMSVVTTGGGMALPITMTGLSIVGSNNTALTIEFSAGVTNGCETVNLYYHKLGGTGT